MVKLRSAYYCNLKLLLLGLVVYGHWIEPGIWSHRALMTQYRWIYLVHMPLFAFLSGLFVGKERDCLQQLRKVLPLYLLAQAGTVMLGGARPQTPYWHLWYLLSLSTWLALGWLWLRFGRRRWRWAALAGSVALGCLAGFLPWVGRAWSLSRSLVFFPWFFLGLLCRPEIPWRRFRLPALAGLAAAIGIGSRVSIPVTFLYHAALYSRPEEAFLRLVSYLLAFLLGLFLLAWCPAGRFPFTQAGADTMPAYLLHAPIVLALREWSLPFAAPGAAILLYILFKAFRWRSCPCGILPGERSVKPWPDSRKSMKHTENRSTGSCWP